MSSSAADCVDATGSSARKQQFMIYVDVRLEDGMDASRYLRSQAESLGAQTLNRWNDRGSKATHVVWQGGDEIVLREARAAGKPVLTPSWVDASVKLGRWQTENNFLLRDDCADACSATRYLRDFRLLSTARGSKRKRGGGQSRFETRRNSDSIPGWFTLPPAARWHTSQASTTQASATQTVLYSTGGHSSVSEQDSSEKGPWSYIRRTASAIVGYGNFTNQAPSQQAPPPTIIVIDDDDDDMQRAPDSILHTTGLDSRASQPSSAAPSRRVDPSGVLPVSARDRYWDDDDQSSSIPRGQTTPAVALESKLAQVATGGHAEEKEDDDEPPKKRYKPKTESGDKKIIELFQIDDENDEQKRTPNAMRTDDDTAKVNLQSNDIEIIETSPEAEPRRDQVKEEDDSVIVLNNEKWRTNTTSIVISASGVDASVREAIKLIANRGRRNNLRARFIDEQLLTKFRATSVPPKATHLVVPSLIPGRSTPRTLKVLFALARGGTFIVSSEWITTSMKHGEWQNPHSYLAGFGPPRSPATKLFHSVKVHLLTSSLGNTEPAQAALSALIHATGAKVSNLKSAAIVLVGEHYSLPLTASGALQSAANNGRILKVRWFFDAIEHNNPNYPNESYRIVPSR